MQSGNPRGKRLHFNVHPDPENLCIISKTFWISVHTSFIRERLIKINLSLFSKFVSCGVQFVLRWTRGQFEFEMDRPLVPALVTRGPTLSFAGSVSNFFGAARLLTVPGLFDLPHQLSLAWCPHLLYLFVLNMIVENFKIVLIFNSHNNLQLVKINNLYVIQAFCYLI